MTGYVSALPLLAGRGGEEDWRLGGARDCSSFLADRGGSGRGKVERDGVLFFSAILGVVVVFFLPCLTWLQGGDNGTMGGPSRGVCFSRWEHFSGGMLHRPIWTQR
jgi:hypothetical protein